MPLDIFTALATLATLAAPSPPPPSPPPDPGAGERLDGRAAPEERDAGRTVLKVAAAPARAAAWLVLTPVDGLLGWIERKKLPQRAYELSTSDDRLIGLRPVIRYDPGYAIGGGVRTFDRRSFGPGSLIESSVRGGSRSLEAGFALEPPGDRGLRLTFELRRRTDYIFGGTQGDTREELRARGLEVVRYAASTAWAELSWRRRLAPLIAVDAGGSVENRIYGDGAASSDTPGIRSVYCAPPATGACPVDPALVPGFNSGVRLLRAQAGAAFDTRHGYRFGGGVFARVTGGYAHGFGGDASRHLALRAGLGGTLPLHDRSLTLYVRASVVEPLAAAPIPFDELASPSGPSGIRGLPRGRLRGPSDLVATLEYRWLVGIQVDGVLFIDHGNAFGPRFAGLAPGRAYTSAGAALTLVEPHDSGYWISVPWLTVQVAVAADDGVGAHLAFVVGSL